MFEFTLESEAPTPRARRLSLKVKRSSVSRGDAFLVGSVDDYHGSPDFIIAEVHADGLVTLHEMGLSQLGLRTSNVETR